MFSHIFIGVTDFDRALAFYTAVMDALGLERRFCEPEQPWAGWHSAGGARPLLLIGHPFDGQPHHPGNGQMAALAAPDHATVRRAYQAALADLRAEAELAKAGDDVEEFTADKSENWRAIRMLDGHVLEFLQSKRIINGDQFCAGAQFYSDWYNAGLAASGVIDPGRVIVDGGQVEHTTDRQLNSLHEWTRAVRAVGLIHSQVLTDILLTEEKLLSYGMRRFGIRSEKLAKHAATTALKLALEQLDYYYHGQRKTRTRASHATDYRPGIHAVETGD